MLTTKIRLSSVIFLLAVLSGGKGMAQNDAPGELKAQWIHYRSTHPDEKVFVHTDKDFYLAGEICWFKYYDVSAQTHKLADVSKVGYVEILDVTNKPVLQAKIGLNEGGGSGSFYLPFTLASGKYTLRAYTNWMKNTPAEFFFEKPLTVINTREGYTPPSVERTGAVSVHFFPEGGNLVTGLASTVAFKGVNAGGIPIDFTGILLDDKGDTLLRFSPLTMGMGHFTFTPATGRSYRAYIQPAGASPLTADLPSVFQEGYVMHVDTAMGDKIQIDVNTNKPGEGMLYLLVQTRGSLKIAEGKAPANGHVTFGIDKATLGEGISQLTIFNSERQPVCERLYFKYPADPGRLSISTDRPVYGSRAPVIVKGSSGGANLSMAVYKLDSLQPMDQSNIYSYLWLDADIAGPVYSPGYYFDRVGPETVAAMDNLLLTQGWRRFRWQDIMTDKAPSFTYVPEYRGHIITGKMVDVRTGAPTKDINGYLSVPGKWTQFATCTSDSNGAVAFDMKNMYGSSEIIVQANTAYDSAYRIEIADPFSEVYPTHPDDSFALPLRSPVTLTEHSVSMQVQNAYYAKQAQQFYLPAAVDTTPFYSHPDLTYKLDDYTRFTTMEEVLREYVQLVNVSRRGEHFHLWAFDAPAGVPFDDDPLLLLDGVPIFNTDQLMKYDPFKIQKVDVLTRRYFLGDDSFTGILNWVTYKGDLSGYQLDPHATAIDYEGLQKQREFYSPDYATDAQKASRLPDFRNVLYWNPNVHLEQADKNQADFYTSDLPGKYVIVVQGISKEGKPLYGMTTLDVQK